MQLPSQLRAAVDALLEDTPIDVLKQAARRLSERYRAELRDGRLHMSEDLAVKAYLATRLPATYAAVWASCDAIAEARPDWSPASLLDVGAGPGTALWAAADTWPDLSHATLLETSEPARRMGQNLAGHLPFESEWKSGDATRNLSDLAPADLVTCAYVLDELEPPARVSLVDQLWRLAADTLLIVEPGTPAGWQRILACRARLIEAGAHVLAPCVHAAPCPLTSPDWCHFSRRVARSRIHRLAKDAEVPWEDEKFAYIAVSRHRPDDESQSMRVLAPQRAGSGKVELKLCCPDGSAATKLFTKRNGETFKRAKRADWGDALTD